jgi:DNA-binding NarL/FixJ family response regulator
MHWKRLNSAESCLAVVPEHMFRGEACGVGVRGRAAGGERPSLRRVAGGGTALDPQVVSGLLANPEENGPLRSLSGRERQVLELVAEGRSNRAISEHLAITHGAVQKHVSTIFTKLGLPAGADDDRRILAVLAYLQPDH